MRKQWEDIPGYVGIYQVNKYGLVKSLPRKVRRGDHTMVIQEKILMAGFDKQGYLIVSLWRDGIGKTHKVHHLVATQFIRARQHGEVINHLNRLRFDNFYKNLEWTTQRENATHGKLSLVKSSQFTGVSWIKGKNKWQSSITINRVAINLGNFLTEEAAADQYHEALKKHKLNNKYAKQQRS